MTDENRQTAAPKQTQPVLQKLILEFGPLAVFFFANARGEQLMTSYPQLAQWFDKPIFLATAAFMVAMAIALVASWILTKHLAVMPLVTGIVVAIFGGLTLVFHDDTCWAGFYSVSR